MTTRTAQNVPPMMEELAVLTRMAQSKTVVNASAALEITQPCTVYATIPAASGTTYDISVMNPVLGDEVLIMAVGTPGASSAVHVTAAASGTTITESDGKTALSTNFVLDASGEYVHLGYRAANQWQTLRTNATET